MGLSNHASHARVAAQVDEVLWENEKTSSMSDVGVSGAIKQEIAFTGAAIFS